MQSSTANDKLAQGTVVWAVYPLTYKVDKSKRRPVLIVSNEQSNGLDNDYIVLPVTRTIRQDPFSLLIQPEDILGSLPVVSELRCNKPFTIRNTLILETIGVLNQNKLDDAITKMHASTLIEK